MVQAAVFDLAYMYQTIALAKEVHKSSEINDFHHFAIVNLTHFGLGND